ncbi:uncharacterized protein LOC125052003 [Pieris napi]|uniref:uncharacterized protein LOC125052003 n=1 Tax=Pieris napi TaxID=78633 RepID=UPI001FB9346D|nr:uncharacterized protein LOC125052003 [Pieris napi]
MANESAKIGVNVLATRSNVPHPRFTRPFHITGDIVSASSDKPSSSQSSSTSEEDEEPPPQQTFSSVSSPPNAKFPTKKRLDGEAGSQPANWTLKQAQRLLGYLNFATFITHRGRLRCRTLQRHSNAFRRAPLCPSSLAEVNQDVVWCLHNLSHKTPIHFKTRHVNYIVTDASDLQWGALINNKPLNGSWTQSQIEWHCNLKEMHAVVAAISLTSEVLKNSMVILQSDSKTVVSYIKNEGGTRSQMLLKLTKDLLALTDSLNIVLIPHFLAGNVQRGSRLPLAQSQGHRMASLERGNHGHIQTMGNPRNRSFRVTRGSCRGKLCVARLIRLQHLLHHAFSKCWRYDLAWIFPPPVPLPRVLHHLNLSQGKFIIIAPRWRKPFWRPDLKGRALAPSLPIRNLNKTLINTVTGQPPPQGQKLQLEAWLILAAKHETKNNLFRRV